MGEFRKNSQNGGSANLENSKVLAAEFKFNSHYIYTACSKANR